MGLQPTPEAARRKIARSANLASVCRATGQRLPRFDALFTSPMHPFPRRLQACSPSGGLGMIGGGRGRDVHQQFVAPQAGGEPLVVGKANCEHTFMGGDHRFQQITFPLPWPAIRPSTPGTSRPARRSNCKKPCVRRSAWNRRRPPSAPWRARTFPSTNSRKRSTRGSWCCGCRS